MTRALSAARPLGGAPYLHRCTQPWCGTLCISRPLSLCVTVKREGGRITPPPNCQDCGFGTKDAPTEFRSRRVLGLHKRVHTYPCKQPPFAYYSSAVRFWQSLATSLSDGKVASSCTLTIVSAARAPSLRHRPGNWSDLGNRALRC